MSMIELDLPEGRIEVAAEFADPEIGLADLARIVREWSGRASELIVAQSAAAGRPAACGPGCGACCRQLVTISSPEALMIAELIEAMPEERQEIIRGRIDRIAERLEEENLIEEVERLDDLALTEADHFALAERYFRLGLACPFLENESCSIHPERPCPCREYHVLSPTRLCRDPFANAVESLEPKTSFSHALGLTCALLLKTEIQMIPLALASRWAARHSEVARRRWNNESLVGHFLLALEAQRK